VISLTPSFGPLHFPISPHLTNFVSQGQQPQLFQHPSIFVLRRRRHHASSPLFAPVESSCCRPSSLCHSSPGPLWESASHRIVPHRCIITRSSPRPAAEKRPSPVHPNTWDRSQTSRSTRKAPVPACVNLRSASLPFSSDGHRFLLGSSSRHYIERSPWRIV